MSRISSDVAFKKGQENAISAINSVERNRIADSYYKVAEEACSSLYDKGVTAGLLSNFQRVMDSDLGQALTTSQDFGPYVMEVWPLVTAWYPDFPLKDLISVQQMDKPLAYMFFSLLKTGTSKADTVVGDVVETATGMRQIRGKYPTGEIFGEVIKAADLVDEGGHAQALLAYAPLNVAEIPGYRKKIKVSVKKASSTDEYVYYSVQGNEVHLALKSTPTVDSGVTIDIQTGLIQFTEAKAGIQEVTVNYVWNLDYATVDNIQKVKEQVELRPMEATPRALMLEWTLFSEYLKKSQFGQDIRQDNTKRILNLLYQNQVRYILDELYDYAEGEASDVVIPNSTAISLDVKANTVMQSLKKIANKIEIASGRIEGNRLVVGQNFKAFVESLPNTWFEKSTSAENYGFSGPREIGKFGTFTVYYDPFREADAALMTYRGNEWYDAAYYLGEYMPIVPTDAIALGVDVRESFVSMEAYKFDKPSCVFKFKIREA